MPLHVGRVRSDVEVHLSDLQEDVARALYAIEMLEEEHLMRDEGEVELAERVAELELRLDAIGEEMIMTLPEAGFSPILVCQ
jgi:hypothetical protein